MVVAMLASAGAWGEFFADQKETMRGISGVKVVVEHLNDKAEEAGLNLERVQRTAELELRKAGIKVLSEEEWLNTEGFPRLYINITTSFHAQANDSLVGFAVSMELKQLVVLARDASKECTAVTWTARSAGSVGANNIDKIRTDGLISDLEEFINDWLTVNPKK
jgi:hypothetical protein